MQISYKFTFYYKLHVNIYSISVLVNHFLFLIHTSMLR